MCWALVLRAGLWTKGPSEITQNWQGSARIRQGYSGEGQGYSDRRRGYSGGLRGYSELREGIQRSGYAAECVFHSSEWKRKWVRVPLYNIIMADILMENGALGGRGTSTGR